MNLATALTLSPRALSILPAATWDEILQDAITQATPSRPIIRVADLRPREAKCRAAIVVSPTVIAVHPFRSFIAGVIDIACHHRVETTAPQRKGKAKGKKKAAKVAPRPKDSVQGPPIPKEFCKTPPRQYDEERKNTFNAMAERAAEMRAEGSSNKAIMAELKIAKSSLQRYLASTQTNRKSLYPDTSFRDSQIVKLYNQGIKVSEIAQRIDVTRTNIYHILKREGLRD